MNCQFCFDNKSNVLICMEMWYIWQIVGIYECLHVSPLISFDVLIFYVHMKLMTTDLNKTNTYINKFGDTRIKYTFVNSLVNYINLSDPPHHVVWWGYLE